MVCTQKLASSDALCECGAEKAQQLQQRPEDMMRVWAFLNNKTVEHLALPVKGPVWVVEEYNAFPIDCATVQYPARPIALCQIRAEELYAKGPRPNAMAMLRLFSSVDPHWVEAYQASQASHHDQYLMRIFVNSIDGASASYPGYDVSYLSGCLPADLSCNLAWRPSASTIHLKSIAVWIEQRLKSWQDNGTANEDNIFVLSPPFQQTVDQRTVLSAATALSVNVGDDVEYILNQSLRVNSSPSAVVGVDLDYHGFSEKVTETTKLYSEYYCGRKGHAGVTVECLIVDESGTLVLHPIFERPDFVPATKYIGDLEPELSQLLVELHIINPRPKQVVTASLTEVNTYVIDFDKLPQNGTFFGSQTGTYNMVRIPQTNLAFIHITGYESHGNIGYCGILTATCPKVTFPNQEDINFDVCTPEKSYYEADEAALETGHLPESGQGVPKEQLTSSQIGMVMGGNLAICDEEADNWWVWLLIAIAGVIVLCSGLGFLLIQQEESYNENEDACKKIKEDAEAEQEKEKRLVERENNLDDNLDDLRNHDDVGYLDVTPKGVHVEM